MCHLTLVQAIGATTPVFTAVLAVAMMGKRESGIVYAALLPVVIGIVIATGAAGFRLTCCMLRMLDNVADDAQCQLPDCGHSAVQVQSLFSTWLASQLL